MASVLDIWHVGSPWFHVNSNCNVMLCYISEHMMQLFLWTVAFICWCHLHCCRSTILTCASLFWRTLHRNTFHQLHSLTMLARLNWSQHQRFVRAVFLYLCPSYRWVGGICLSICVHMHACLCASPAFMYASRLRHSQPPCCQFLVYHLIAWLLFLYFGWKAWWKISSMSQRGECYFRACSSCSTQLTCCVSHSTSNRSLWWQLSPW